MSEKLEYADFLESGAYVKKLEETYNRYLDIRDKKLVEFMKENKRLHSIIKEVREYIENHSITNMEWWITRQQKVECKFMEDANPQELLELLDKGSDKE